MNVSRSMQKSSRGRHITVYDRGVKVNAVIGNGLI